MTKNLELEFGLMSVKPKAKITISLDDESVATVTDWWKRRKGSHIRSGLGAARAYAKEHGKSTVMLASDGATVFTYDTNLGEVRSVTYKPTEVRWV